MKDRPEWIALGLPLEPAAGHPAAPQLMDIVRTSRQFIANPFRYAVECVDNLRGKIAVEIPKRHEDITRITSYVQVFEAPMKRQAVERQMRFDAAAMSLPFERGEHDLEREVAAFEKWRDVVDRTGKLLSRRDQISHDCQSPGRASPDRCRDYDIVGARRKEIPARTVYSMVLVEMLDLWKFLTCVRHQHLPRISVLIFGSAYEFKRLLPQRSSA